MDRKTKTISFILLICSFDIADAQILKQQQGLLLKTGTSIRLGGIQVLNKHNMLRTKSNVTGVFNIQASSGDTLTFRGDNFKEGEFVVTDFADKIIYLQPIIQLAEVEIKENSLKADIMETQRGYREKSVFYTGKPHYYYLVLKPMTFIYENFKSEVIEARRFNRYAKNEIVSYKIAERYNDEIIKNTVLINGTELDDFKWSYMPTIEQLNKMSDYDIIIYIRNSYAAYEHKGLVTN